MKTLALTLFAITLCLSQALPEDDEKKALKTFEKEYALPDGVVLKRLAPPMPASRMAFFRHHSPALAPGFPEGPGAMFLRWHVQILPEHRISSAQGHSIQELPRLLGLDIYPQEIEGAAGLLQTRIEGDFVVRVDAPVEKVIARLQEILQTECHLTVRVTLTLRTVERKVYVARGKYKYTPAPGQPKARHGRIELYNKELSIAGGGGGGDLATFLKKVGNFIDRRIVAGDVENAPKHLYAQYNLKFRGTPADHQQDRDPQAVLQHVSEQTNLTFTEETRPVRALFVE